MKKYIDELRFCEEYGNDYTIKAYEREDCKFYAVVVYESDDCSKVIYTSKALNRIEQAKSLAREKARMHEQDNH